MPQGNCYLSIIPAFPSRPHPHSHSGQHFGVCACVPLAYCRRVSFAISQYSGILAVNSQVHTPAISYFRPSISRRPFPIYHPPSATPKKPNPQLLVAIVAHFRRIHLAHLMAQTKPNGYAKGKQWVPRLWALKRIKNIFVHLICERAKCLSLPLSPGIERW